MSAYTTRVMESMSRRNPNQPEFHQAVEEVVSSLEAVFERRPEFVKAGIDGRPPVAEQAPLEALSFPRHVIPGLSTAPATLPEARRWVTASDYGKKACGSFGSPLTRTSKWRWGPVEKPVLPISPITSPWSTRSPGDAWITDMWA